MPRKPAIPIKAYRRRLTLLRALSETEPRCVDNLMDWSVPEGCNDPVRLHRLRETTLRMDLRVLEAQNLVERHLVDPGHGWRTVLAFTRLPNVNLS